MNPYIIVGIMLVVDIISIPFIIKSILKKDIQRKGLIITLFLVAFIAVEAAFSVFYINANQFYDRAGNTYTSEENIIYYDRDGNEFILYQTKVDRRHFISKDSKYMYIAERVYVDADGFLVYDKYNDFKKTDREFVYADADGNEYFRAEEIKWNHKGEIKIRERK